jgi:hypothetical protein
MSEIQLRVQQVVQHAVETRYGPVGPEGPNVIYYAFKAIDDTLENVDEATRKGSSSSLHSKDPSSSMILSKDIAHIPVMSVPHLLQFLKIMAWVVLRPFRTTGDGDDACGGKDEYRYYCLRSSIGELALRDDFKQLLPYLERRTCTMDTRPSQGCCVEALVLVPSIYASLVNLTEAMYLDAAAAGDTSERDFESDMDEERGGASMHTYTFDLFLSVVLNTTNKTNKTKDRTRQDTAHKETRTR